MKQITWDEFRNNNFGIVSYIENRRLILFYSIVKCVSLHLLTIRETFFHNVKSCLNYISLFCFVFIKTACKMPVSLLNMDFIGWPNILLVPGNYYFSVTKWSNYSWNAMPIKVKGKKIRYQFRQIICNLQVSCSFH